MIHNYVAETNRTPFELAEGESEARSQAVGNHGIIALLLVSSATMVL